jgi:hypothetical protein
MSLTRPLVIAIVAVASGQEPASAPIGSESAPASSPRPGRAVKLSEPWVRNVPWRFDYDEARAAARESGRLVFGFFTRADAP